MTTSEESQRQKKDQLKKANVYRGKGGAPADLAGAAAAAAGADDVKMDAAAADDDDHEGVDSELIVDKIDVLMKEVLKLKRSLRKRNVISQGSDAPDVSGSGSDAPGGPWTAVGGPTVGTVPPGTIIQ